jgi:hypothetical protein
LDLASTPLVNIRSHITPAFIFLEIHMLKSIGRGNQFNQVPSIRCNPIADNAENQVFEKRESTHRKITKMTTKRLEKPLERVENGEEVEAEDDYEFYVAASISSRRPPRKSTLTEQKNQKRQRATQDQLRTLEEEFNKNPTPSKRSKAAKAAAERSKERIEEIIELVRKLHNGQSVDEGFLIKRELNGKESTSRRP